jgi:hypothetical protein
MQCDDKILANADIYSLYPAIIFFIVNYLLLISNTYTFRVLVLRGNLILL